MIKELGILLDAGLPITSIPEFIFVTHGHADHIFNLPMVLVDMGNVRPEIFVPNRIKDNVWRFIDSTYQMSTQNPKPKIHNKYTLTGCESGEVLSRKIKGKTYQIKVFHCFHTVPTVAYGFTEVRKKLKPEYLALPGREIGLLKKSGVEITEEVEYHQFCYIGDTSENVFNPKKNSVMTFRIENEAGEITEFEDLEIFKYPVLIVECTFLEKSDEKQAKKTRHMYWPKLKPIIMAHPKHLFILYHFSRRYSPKEIRHFFKLQNQSNVHIWI